MRSSSPRLSRGPTPLLDPEALREFCARSIARYKVPKTVEFVTELPRTGSGKLLRRHLDARQRPSPDGLGAER